MSGISLNWIHRHFIGSRTFDHGQPTIGQAECWSRVLLVKGPFVKRKKQAKFIVQN